MKRKRYYQAGLLCAVLILLCSGCGDGGRNTAGERDDETMKQISVHSGDEALDIMETYLNETYGVEWKVLSPSRDEEGNFIAQAYRADEQGGVIWVLLDVAAGECRDSTCVEQITSYLENTLRPQVQTEWENGLLQVFCELGTKAPLKVWDTEAEIQDIIDAEDVRCHLFLVIDDAQPDKEEEARRLQTLIQSSELEGARVIMDAFYVTSEVFGATQDELAEGILLYKTTSLKEYINAVTVERNRRHPQVSVEDIVNGFN